MNSTRSLKKLINDVEELLAELGDHQRPDIQELRERIEDTIGPTKHAVSKRSGRVAQIGHYASSVNHYILDYPRLAFLTGALIFGTLGYLAGATGKTRTRAA